MRTLARLFLVVLLGGAGLAATVVALTPQARAILSSGDAGDSDRIDLDPLAQNSTVYDANGTPLAVLHAEENRSPIKLKQVPSAVIDTILAVEDQDFWRHGGVNLKSTLRALVRNVSEGEVVQGGSTITQQVIKNSLLTPEKDVNRKVREAILAVRLEDQMDKRDILERYVNTVYLGNGAYGLQAAAEIYFDKDVEQLTTVEAAMLAGMISNPSRYDPFTRPKETRERRRVAVDSMLAEGVITPADAVWINATPIPAEPARVLPKPNDYFVEEVKQRLLHDETLGDTDTERYNLVFKGGLRIHTTLNPTAQAHALAARNEVLANIDRIALGRPEECRPATPDDPPDQPGQLDCFTAAIASLDPRSGAVRAMVGGPGFDKYKFNLATSPNRQTGSSFKVYVLMAALEAGFVPDDSINGGSPCRFPNPGGTPDPYVAENFGGSGGGGGTVTQQTLRSSNCAYLRLGQVVGLDKVVATANRMGVSTSMDPVLSLPLGVAGISPLEMASAYGSIAAAGVRHEPYLIEKIVDRDGKVIFQHEDSAARVLGQQTSCLATRVLEQNVQSGTGTRARLPGRQAAGKTGTAQNFDDAWFVGFTPQLSTAVWMGAPAKKVPMTSVGGIGVTGGTYPARIWGRYMSGVLADQEVLPFPTCADTRHGEHLRLGDDPSDSDDRRSPGRRSRSTATTTTAPDTTEPPSTVPDSKPDRKPKPKPEPEPEPDPDPPEDG